MGSMSLAASALRSPRRRAALLAVLVVSALAIGATLTFEAWRASRDHRRAVNRALAGYANFAVSTYRQQLLGRLYIASSIIFRPVGSSRMIHREPSPPDVSVLVGTTREAARCTNCGPVMRPLYVFRFDARDGSLQTGGGSVSPAQREHIARMVSDLGEYREARDWDYVALFDSLAPTPQLVYITAWRGPDGLPRAVFGFAVELAELRARFLTPMFDSTLLLPVARPRRLRNDSLMALGVIGAGGQLLARISSRELAPTYSTVIPGGGMMGSLRLRLALDPVRAPDELVGGLPPSRGPLLVGLLVLVAGVIATLCLVAWQAAELARLRTEFVAAVSHELRTPLAQILLFADSLRLGRIRARADVENAGDVIVGESRRLIQLVENILLFGRASRGSARVSAEPTALAPVVREVVEFFGPQAQGAEARIQLVRLDDITVAADPNGLRQVLLNLLDNATKYGPAGQTIGVGVTLAGDRARLWVEDEGPGIPDEDRGRVWEPFARLERDLDASVAGSGIGLSVVREIVRQHGGVARVESTPGGSARVVVELPGAEMRSTVDARPACAS